MNNKLEPLKRFWMLLKPDSKDIGNIYIFAIFNGLISLSLPLGIQAIINLIQGGQVNTSWIVLVVFVLIGIAFSGVMQIFQLRISENLQQKIFTRSAFEFAFRVPRIKMEELYKHYAPELMNRFFDTLTLQKGLSKILLDTSSSALQVIFGLLLLSLYHPFFILFSLILVLLVYAIFRFTAPLGLKTSIRESTHKYRVAYWLEELARTHNTFKLAGKTDLPLTRLDGHVSEYITQREGHFKVLVSQYALMIAFKVLVAAGLLIIGGILVMDQSMNIGQFVAAEIIIIIVLASVEKLILSLETVYDVMTSLEKIGQVVDLELETDKGEDISKLPIKNGLEIDIKELDFTYPNFGKKTIDKLTLSIKSGERVLISGNSGSGKSTLLHLMAGLYMVNKGSISYNGIGLNNVNPCSLRSIIGDCLSHEEVFHGSFYDNITMLRPGASKENMYWAIKNMFLEDYINELPDGVDTIIDPEGKKLPKSIAKKIILARCIADKPKLILLEEPFVGIAQNEKKTIIDFLMRKEHPWTIVMISSEPEIFNYIDKEVVMKDGRVDSIIELNKK
jgi:ABC-type bacteriocin/lantibiotic exporter with double-glycine peptidase domain